MFQNQLIQIDFELLKTSWIKMIFEHIKVIFH